MQIDDVVDRRQHDSHHVFETNPSLLSGLSCGRVDDPRTLGICTLQIIPEERAICRIFGRTHNDLL